MKILFKITLKGLALISCFILFCHISLAQSSELMLVPDKKHIYTDGINEGKFHTFEHLFKDTPEQAKSFSTFNTNRKIQSWVNVISGAIVVGGLIDGLRDRSQGSSVVFSRLGVQLRNAALLGVTGNAIAGASKRRAKQSLLLGQDDIFQPENLIIQRDTVIAQSFSQISKHRFSTNEVTRRLHKFGYLFADNPDLKSEFDLFNDYRKKQVRGNITAAGLVIGGYAISFGLIADLDNRAIQSRDYVALLTLIGTSGAGVIVALANNLGRGPKKARHRAALLSQIDPSMVFEQPKESHINLAITQNGLGLVYQFK